VANSVLRSVVLLQPNLARSAIAFVGGVFFAKMVDAMSGLGPGTWAMGLAFLFVAGAAHELACHMASRQVNMERFVGYLARLALRTGAFACTAADPHSYEGSREENAQVRVLPRVSGFSTDGMPLEWIGHLEVLEMAFGTINDQIDLFVTSDLDREFWKGTSESSLEFFIQQARRTAVATGATSDEFAVVETTARTTAAFGRTEGSAGAQDAPSHV